MLNLLLIAGLIFYLCFVINNNLAVATISLLLFLYVWILGNMYHDKFNIYDLIHISGYVGLLFSITYFFMYGVEEVPYPEGAIMFHSPEIAFSLFVCFISTVIVLYAKFSSPPKAVPQTEKRRPLPQKQHEEIKREEWEEATLEDLESGAFELVG